MPLSFRKVFSGGLFHLVERGREWKNVPAPDEGGTWEGNEKVVGAHQRETTKVERLEERPQAERKEEEARGSVSEEGAHRDYNLKKKSKEELAMGLRGRSKAETEDVSWGAARKQTTKIKHLEPQTGPQ